MEWQRQPRQAAWRGRSSLSPCGGGERDGEMYRTRPERRSGFQAEGRGFEARRPLRGKAPLRRGFLVLERARRAAVSAAG